MAQRSKKGYIVACALPLFLEHGFKGMSIDMVVRVSGVSKPTVYNHFPDKAALMSAAMERWIEDNKPSIAPIGKAVELDAFIRERWLTDEAVRLYAVVIGEGWRFPRARKLFWERYDNLWRIAFGYVCENSASLDSSAVERELDRQLLDCLRSQ